MIITCPVCLTKFKLAAERIPAGGAKARCSKCQHIFSISKEPALPAEPQGAEFPAAPPQIPGPAAQKVRVWTPPKPSGLRKGLRILIIILILAGATYGLGKLGSKIFIKEKGHGYYSALRSFLGLRKGAQGYIALERIRGYYLENKHRQRIFVVEGEAVNRWNEPRSFIKVKGTLLDTQGDKIEEKSSYCGNILLEEDLKNFPPAAIEKSLAAQFGETFANVNIPPGKGIPFMIVFTNFSANQASAKKISNFQVEVISSQKGT